MYGAKASSPAIGMPHHRLPRGWIGANFLGAVQLSQQVQLGVSAICDGNHHLHPCLLGVDQRG
ncbi:hypothetical protein D9M71_171300 [compost metagenome]